MQKYSKEKISLANKGKSPWNKDKNDVQNYDT
jgi:hypothetical protein